MRPGPVHVFWFRRDLRLIDNQGLSVATHSGRPVVPVFIFDTDILASLEEKRDRRVNFIHRALAEMQRRLANAGSSLDVRTGTPLEVFRQLLQDYEVEAVFANRDYEPYAKK